MLKKAAVLIIGLVLLVSAIPVSAPAVKISADACYMPASDYNTNGNVIIGTGKAVFSSDNNGNSKITCKAVQPKEIPYPDKAVHYNYANTGVLCDTTFGITEDWEAVITPGGQATITCKINPSSTP